MWHPYCKKKKGIKRVTVLFFRNIPTGRSNFSFCLSFQPYVVRCLSWKSHYVPAGMGWDEAMDAAHFLSPGSDLGNWVDECSRRVLQLYWDSFSAVRILPTFVFSAPRIIIIQKRRDPELKSLAQAQEHFFPKILFFSNILLGKLQIPHKYALALQTRHSGAPLYVTYRRDDCWLWYRKSSIYLEKVNNDRLKAGCNPEHLQVPREPIRTPWE